VSERGGVGYEYPYQAEERDSRNAIRTLPKGIGLSGEATEVPEVPSELLRIRRYMALRGTFLSSYREASRQPLATIRQLALRQSVS
jgi:hypothetical protein